MLHGRLTVNEPHGAREHLASRRALRMDLAAGMIAARAEAATQAREHSMLLARMKAERTAQSAAHMEQMQRKFQERLIENEKVAARQRSLREATAAKTRAETARQRAALEEQIKQEEKALLESQRRARLELEAARTAAEAHAVANARQEALRRLLEERAGVEARDEFFYTCYERKARAEAARAHRGKFAPPQPPSEAPVLPSCEEIEDVPIDDLATHVLRHQGCPHRCLGLAPNARVQAVRKRYLALARRLHPDKSDHPNAALAFAAIEAAFRGMTM
ncbi:MAG: hypothetical protein SGPRY_004121 [Prymnesium sp.]